MTNYILAEYRLNALNKLENKLRPDDWMPESLFGERGRVSDVFGVILKVPQLKRNLDEVVGRNASGDRLGEITRDWVNGKKLPENILRQKVRRPSVLRKLRRRVKQYIVQL